MNSGIPASGRPDESLEQLFGSIFDVAGQFAAQISQDEIEARLRRTLRSARRLAPVPQAAPSRAVGQPEPVLVSRAAAGNAEAWVEIVDRYAPLVWSICQRHRVTGHDAEDVGQTVWLLLVEQLGTLHDPAALPGWLARTTSRECLRVLGRVRDEPARLADDATIDAEILAAVRDTALLTASLGLPPRCRQLLSMLASDPPHSYAEISAALGIPIGSIGPQRARCLDRLRKAVTHPPLGDEQDPH